MIDSRLESVAAVFEQVLAEGGGGAFAAYIDGVLALDLWGGELPEGRPWEETTPCLIFSGTKGLVAASMLMLIERHTFSLDTRVAEIWSEFAAAGKDQVTIAQVLSHTAGLPGIEAAFGDLTNQKEIADRIAAAPLLTPAGAVTYHALTFGTICDAIIRRVDGRTTGRFVAEEIAAPLSLEAWIGAPEEVAERAAVPFRAPDFELAAHLASAPDPRLAFAYGQLATDWSSLLTGEIPSANAVATARAMARFYAALIGEVEGIRLLASDHRARTELAAGLDVLSGRPLRFSAGFELAGTPSFLGPVPDVYGFTGSGGSTHGAWPSLRTTFSYCMTVMRPEHRDTRAARLLTALAEAVG
ncbi:MAG: serine hydrolase domain-containing protein [Acidimicrobiia bacterium]